MNRADHRKWILALCVAMAVIAARAARAQAVRPAARERAQVRSAEAGVTKAANLYRAKKFAEAGKVLDEVQQTLDRLTENDSTELAALTENVRKRMARARELLKAEGVEVRAAKPAEGAPKKDTDKAPQQAAPTVLPAADDDEVLFTRDLGKTLVDNCLGCHGEDNPRNNFSMATFNRLLQGGDSGPVIVQGKPEESLLVKKLRGMAGERMPLDRPPLAEEAIARFEKWLALGGRFDGADANAPLEDTVALTAALSASHDELAKSRAELAARNWRLMLPDAKPAVQETPNVLVYGSVDASVLAKVATLANELAVKLAKLFKLPDGPLVKGRLTLYVFDKRYDYGEVGRMLEEREIPAASRGHWRYTGVDAYGCVLLENDEASPGLVAQQIAGAYVASLGKMPRWFAEGTARAVAERFDPRDARVKRWDEQLARLLKSLDTPEAFLSGELPPEDGDVLGYGFVKYLMNAGGRHATVLAAVREGATFDDAFLKAYGRSPQELAGEWKVRAARRR